MREEELQSIIKLIKTLVTTPNADENIRLVLKMAEESVTAETLKNLMNNGKLVSRKNDETKNKDILEKDIKGKGKLSDSNKKFGFELTKQEKKVCRKG